MLNEKERKKQTNRETKKQRRKNKEGYFFSLSLEYIAFYNVLASTSRSVVWINLLFALQNVKITKVSTVLTGR